MGVTYTNAQSNTGTTTATAPASPGTTWNLTSLSVSQAGGWSGVNAKLVVYDGAVGGTVIFSVFLNGPGAVGTGLGSVGSIQDIPLPRDPQGRPCLQGTPGNAMNVQVVGTGGNQVSVNARFSDALP